MGKEMKATARKVRETAVSSLRGGSAREPRDAPPIPLKVPKKNLAAFCRRNYIKKLSLFGSVLRHDFRPDSDIDVLVEFEPGHTPGLAFFGMQEELSEMLGRKVDLNTPACLSRYFRDQVLKDAKVVYGES